MNYPSPTAVLNIGLITSNPDVRSGRPVILGTSLEVVDIVLVRLHQRLDADEIAVWFQISPAEAHAALAYYYRNYSGNYSAIISSLDLMT